MTNGIADSWNVNIDILLPCECFELYSLRLAYVDAPYSIGIPRIRQVPM